MAETTADVRRDIEMTRERMSTTLAQLEQKLNLMRIVQDNPWPSLGLALGAGFLLSGSRVDVKAAAATVTATKGASGRVGSLLDDLVANLVTGVHGAFQDRVEGWVAELKGAIGAAVPQGHGGSAGPRQTVGSGAVIDPHSRAAFAAGPSGSDIPRAAGAAGSANRGGPSAPGDTDGDAAQPWSPARAD